MGSVIVGSCECGFVSDEMNTGGGRFSYKTFCGFPFLCRECNSIVASNICGDSPVCKKCYSANVVRYDDKSLCKKDSQSVFLWRLNDNKTILELKRDGNYCPACKQHRLVFEKIGLWD